MDEQWKPIPTWETLYEVSDLGNIRSLERRVEYTNQFGAACVRTFKARQLQPKPDGRGRREVRLYESSDGKVLRQSWRMVYRAVWEAFNGPIPTGLTVDHIDENSSNDVLSNLQLLSVSDNVKKNRVAKPESRRGAKHHNALLTDEIVSSAVRPLLAAGTPIAVVARAIGVGETAIRDIRDGKTWVHAK